MHRTARRGSLARPGVRAALLALALVGGLPVAARAADSPQEEERRLEFCLALVKHFDNRGADAYVRDAVATVDAVGKPTDDLLALRDSAWLWRGSALLEPEGDVAAEKRAFEYLSSLHDKGATEAARGGAVQPLVTIWGRRGERREGDGNDEGALDAYDEALALDASHRGTFEKVRDLSVRVANRYEKDEDFDTALGRLQSAESRITRQFGAGDPLADPVRTAIERIHANTGPLWFRWLGRKAELITSVKGPVVDYTSAVLSFTSQDGGKAPRDVTVVPGARNRVRIGSFRVIASAGDGTPIRFDLVVDSQGTHVDLPSVVPDGMVYVSATDRIEAFLIDRTEVSVAQFRPFAEEAGVAWLEGQPDDHPARGFSFATAERYAKYVGKQLPNEGQWTRAALETPEGRERPFPWGDEAPVKGRHLIAGRARSASPGPVDGCPDGASAFGALNMAGNVGEWIDADGYGWIIGGTFTSAANMSFRIVPGDENEEFLTWTASLLKDPFPTDTAFEAGKYPQTREHYYPLVRIDERYWPRIGVRCVIPLGLPRDMP